MNLHIIIASSECEQVAYYIVRNPKEAFYFRAIDQYLHHFYPSSFFTIYYSFFPESFECNYNLITDEPIFAVETDLSFTDLKIFIKHLKTYLL